MNRRGRQSRQSLQNEHSEDFRIGIDIIFRDFCADAGATEYTFRPDLSNVERKYIHEKCRRLGLKSKSRGKEPNRVLGVSKGVGAPSADLELRPSAEGLAEIQSFVARNCGGPPSTFNDLHDVMQHDTDIGRLNFGAAPAVRGPRCSDYDDFRRNLPVREMRDHILDTVERSAVTIVSGETGSGKTTQVPQYILERHCETSRPCRIICTQPRRISTVAVAERVAAERGEDVGQTCGYQIKLDSRLGPSTALVYCTTGVLLRTLMGGFDVLNDISHIILDEIHERDKFTDFVLISLRECLRIFRSLRLVLMSATMDVELFESYFPDVARVNVKGRTYPIEHYFLDRILVELSYESEQMRLVKMKNEQRCCNGHDGRTPPDVAVCDVDESLLREMDETLLVCMEDPSEENFMQMLHLILSDEVSVNHSEMRTGYTPLIVAAANGNLDYTNQLLHLGADVSMRCKEEKTAVDWATEARRFDAAKLIRDFDVMKRVSRGDALGLYGQTVLEDFIDHDLIVAIVTHIHVSSADNMGVLVFLPGYDDIVALYEALARAPVASALKVCMLHGSMMINAQHDVFRRSAKRKVILSTNVAETSITIDDIAHVIDTGRVKRKSYDSLSGTSSLETTWISIASLKQRAGRAGRCAPGVCYHLFSKSRYESLLVNTIPEILTVPLHELCLQTKLLAPQGTKIADFLSKALEAPGGSAIENAIAGLVSLGALDSEENLTILGSHLLKLCIEPHLGKMLLYSIILKCLDPVLTIVATLAHKEPFVLPSKGVEKMEASQRKKSLTCGTLSDHMGLLVAFQRWQDAKMAHVEERFCKQHFISAGCMEMIAVTRNHIAGQLRMAGFIPISSGIREVTCYSESWPVVKAALCAGLYPNVAFSHSNKLVSRNEKRVLMHSTSCIRGTHEQSSGLWYIFEEMSKIGNLCNLKNVTAVTPLTVVLTAGSTNSFDETTNDLQIDGSLCVNVHCAEVWKFRLAVDSVIRRHVTHPASKFNKFDESVLTALKTVLSAEDSSYNLTHPAGIGRKPALLYKKNAIYVPKNVGQRGPGRFDTHPGSSNGAPVSQSHDISNGPRCFTYGDTSRATNQGAPVNREEQFCPQQQGYGNFANGASSASDESQPSGGRNTDCADRFGVPDDALIDILVPKNVVVGRRAKFFVIRPLELRSIKISLSQCTWHFSPQTERKVFRSFLQEYETYLVFNVRGTTEFQALAKLLDTNNGVPDTSVKIDWISTRSVRYDEVLYSINPRPSIIEDGYETPYNVGLRIVHKMLRDDSHQRWKHCRPILDTPERQPRNPKRQKWKRPYHQQHLNPKRNLQ